MELVGDEFSFISERINELVLQPIFYFSLALAYFYQWIALFKYNLKLRGYTCVIITRYFIIIVNTFQLFAIRAQISSRDWVCIIKTRLLLCLVIYLLLLMFKVVLLTRARLQLFPAQAFIFLHVPSLDIELDCAYLFVLDALLASIIARDCCSYHKAILIRERVIRLIIALLFCNLQTIISEGYQFTNFVYTIG